MARAPRFQEIRDASTGDPGAGRYFLKLYIAGSTPKSTQAIEILKDLCAAFPRGEFEYEVLDLQEVPGLAQRENIIAVPCLVKVRPAPRGACVGLVADRNRMLVKLGLPVRHSENRRKRKK